jgi:hypothetical protein
VDKPLPATLPCLPCPHDSICCSWGTSLYPDEAAAIRENHGGAALTWNGEDDEWRTAIVDGKCYFWRTGEGCSIHEEPFYPRICRGFPWRHGDSNSDYPHDRTICPELADR